jgi:phage-related protein
MLREPYSKKLVGYKNLFELRTVGASAIRLFYTVQNDIFYVLHAFNKKSQKTPQKEINTAVKRIKSLT